MPLHTCFDCQQAIPASYRCTNSGLITTTFHLQNFHFGYSPMVILQLAMTSILNISELHKMKPLAVEISPWQFRICQEANGQFCNIPTPFQPFANPPSCITALYGKNTTHISTRCSLQIRKSSDVSMPSQLAPNVWILTTAPSAVTTTITLICPGETVKLIKVKKPIHVLWLPTACRATSPNFIYPHIMKLHLWK